MLIASVKHFGTKQIIKVATLSKISERRTLWNKTLVYISCPGYKKEFKGWHEKLSISSYFNKIWHGSCFKEVQYGIVKKSREKISAGVAVSPPFLHSSILYLFKATAMPNLRAVTIYLVEFLWLLFLVSKSVTSAPSLVKEVSLLVLYIIIF